MSNVCVFPLQILMSALCPPHVLVKHVQTQRAPSLASTASLVSESPRMGSSAMVRLLPACTGACLLFVAYSNRSATSSSI